MFWLTTGHADEWPIVLWNRDYDGWEQLDMAVTTFMARLATKQLSCSRYSPEAVASLEPTFEED